MSQPSVSRSDKIPALFTPGSLRPWEAAFLVLLVAGLLAAFGIKSNKEYFGHDDFVTVTLVSNPNIGEMLDTIRSGGEVNPPLYFVVQWIVARFFGTGELVMRLTSAISMAAA